MGAHRNFEFSEILEIFYVMRVNNIPIFGQKGQKSRSYGPVVISNRYRSAATLITGKVVLTVGFIVRQWGFPNAAVQQNFWLNYSTSCKSLLYCCKYCIAFFLPCIGEYL